MQYTQADQEKIKVFLADYLPEVEEEIREEIKQEYINEKLKYEQKITELQSKIGIQTDDSISIEMQKKEKLIKFNFQKKYEKECVQIKEQIKEKYQNELKTLKKQIDQQKAEIGRLKSQLNLQKHSTKTSDTKNMPLQVNKNFEKYVKGSPIIEEDKSIISNYENTENTEKLAELLKSMEKDLREEISKEMEEKYTSLIIKPQSPDKLSEKFQMTQGSSTNNDQILQLNNQIERLNQDINVLQENFDSKLQQELKKREKILSLNYKVKLDESKKSIEQKLQSYYSDRTQRELNSLSEDRNKLSSLRSQMNIQNQKQRQKSLKVIESQEKEIKSLQQQIKNLQLQKFVKQSNNNEFSKVLKNSTISNQNLKDQEKIDQIVLKYLNKDKKENKPKPVQNILTQKDYLKQEYIGSYDKQSLTRLYNMILDIWQNYNNKASEVQGFIEKFSNPESYQQQIHNELKMKNFEKNNLIEKIKVIKIHEKFVQNLLKSEEEILHTEEDIKKINYVTNDIISSLSNDIYHQKLLTYNGLTHFQKEN